jgi:arylsulfatase
MRTTLTLDRDLERILRETAVRTRRPFKKVLNDLLRSAVEGQLQGAGTEPFVVPFTTLEKSGELDNTLIVFSADHGELLGDFGCFGKRSFHDASQRVPLIVRQPARFKAGAVCDTPASLVDLLPTFMAAAGHPAPEDADGCDLAALARGGARHTPVYFHYARGRDAILGAVDGDWKYAWSAPDSRSYLFPRHESPEKRNRATDPRCTKVLERMYRMVR